MEKVSELLADILSKISFSVVGYLSQLNPFAGLFAAACFAAAIFFLRRKIKSIWGSGGQSDSSGIAGNLGQEQQISHGVQSGLDNFLDSKTK